MPFGYLERVKWQSAYWGVDHVTDELEMWPVSLNSDDSMYPGRTHPLQSQCFKCGDTGQVPTRTISGSLSVNPVCQPQSG
jgi:hypothetical protein